VPEVDVIVVGDSSSDENERPSSHYSVSDSSSPRPRYKHLSFFQVMVYKLLPNTHILIEYIVPFVYTQLW